MSRPSQGVRACLPPFHVDIPAQQQGRHLAAHPIYGISSVASGPGKISRVLSSMLVETNSMACGDGEVIIKIRGWAQLILSWQQYLWYTPTRSRLSTRRCRIRNNKCTTQDSVSQDRQCHNYHKHNRLDLLVRTC